MIGPGAGATTGIAGPAGRASSARSGSVDLDGHPELDVGVQLHRNLVGPERPDRLIELQPAPVELDTGLSGHRLDDVG